jgi:diguanylate cyclase (GGDEF)-like protein
MKNLSLNQQYTLFYKIQEIHDKIYKLPANRFIFSAMEINGEYTGMLPFYYEPFENYRFIIYKNRKKIIKLLPFHNINKFKYNFTDQLIVYYYLFNHSNEIKVYFKNVNDTYGHEAGDRVLYQFGELVRSQLTGKQEFFRWGGEEFVVYCPGFKREQARALAERIRHQVEVHQFFRHQQITVSAGVAQWYDGNDSQVGIFRRMDDALYAAKCNGRNQVVTE